MAVQWRLKALQNAIVPITIHLAGIYRLNGVLLSLSLCISLAVNVCACGTAHNGETSMRSNNNVLTGII